MHLASHHPFRSIQAQQQYLSVYDQRAKQWPVASHTHMINTSHGDTYVRISGPPDAPPLLLLHGISGNSLQWLPNIAAFSTSYRTYAIDNIYDYGRSIYTRPITGVADFVAWLNELFAMLRLEEPINLVGLSYGGWLASQYALCYPHRLRKLVLLAPVCTVLPLSVRWILRAALCAIPHRFFTHHFLSWLLSDLARSGTTGQTIVQQWVDDSFTALRCFKPKRLVHPTVLTDSELQQLTLPTLFAVGKNEKIYASEQAEQRLNRVAPQIQTVMVSNAGHDLTVVQADTVNQIVLNFLDDTR